MSTYYQAKFMKKEHDGKEYSVTAILPRCFEDILDEIDCKSVREEERDEYTVDVKTYAFDDIRNVYIPRIQKRRKEAEEELKELQENLYKAANKEVYELVRDDISYGKEEIRELDAAIAFAETIVKGVSFHFEYVEELWDDEDIIMETEIC